MSILNNIIDNYRPSIIKQRWVNTKNSPYASLRFQYQVTVGIVILLGILISYTLIKLMLSGSGGNSGIMAVVIKGVYLIIMVILLLKLWQTVTPLRNTLKSYEKNPAAQKSTGREINVVAEVDEILKNIENNKKNKKTGVSVK